MQGSPWASLHLQRVSCTSKRKVLGNKIPFWDLQSPKGCQTHCRFHVFTAEKHASVAKRESGCSPGDVCKACHFSSETGAEYAVMYTVVCTPNLLSQKQRVLRSTYKLLERCSCQGFKYDRNSTGQATLPQTSRIGLLNQQIQQSGVRWH